jgi:hypothetical protein
MRILLVSLLRVVVEWWFLFRTVGHISHSMSGPAVHQQLHWGWGVKAVALVEFEEDLQYRRTWRQQAAAAAMLH